MNATHAGGDAATPVRTVRTSMVPLTRIEGTPCASDRWRGSDDSALLHWPVVRMGCGLIRGLANFWPLLARERALALHRITPSEVRAVLDTGGTDVISRRFRRCKHPQGQTEAQSPDRAGARGVPAIQLDGEHAPRTNAIWYRSLPAGDHDGRAFSSAPMAGRVPWCGTR
jgi:hypothetical protein